MQAVKKINGFKIFKKSSGRYAVKNAQGQWVNAAEKVKILSENGLIKVSVSTKKEEAPAEVAAEGASEAATPAPAEGAAE